MSFGILIWYSLPPPSPPIYQCRNVTHHKRNVLQAPSLNHFTPALHLSLNLYCFCCSLGRCVHLLFSPILSHLPRRVNPASSLLPIPSNAATSNPPHIITPSQVTTTVLPKPSQQTSSSNSSNNTIKPGQHIVNTVYQSSQCYLLSLVVYLTPTAWLWMPVYPISTSIFYSMRIIANEMRHVAALPIPALMSTYNIALHGE